MRRTPVVLALATVGLLALGATSASAAGTRAVPVGDTLYAIACPYYSSDDSQLPAMQLIQLDTATAVGTLVGPGTPALTDVDCAGQGAWNAITSTAYAIAFDFSANGDTALVSIDPASGVSTPVGVFSDGIDNIAVTSIAIAPDGSAFAAGENLLYSLNLGTAGLIEIGGFSEQYAMSFDPTSGALYSVDSTGEISNVNTADASVTLFGQLPSSGIYTFAIDSAGIFWYGIDDNVGGGAYEAELASVDPADLAGSFASSGVITVGETQPYPEALLLVPAVVAPQLAETGRSSDASLAIGAGALGLLGVAALTLRRRRSA